MNSKLVSLAALALAVGLGTLAAGCGNGTTTTQSTGSAPETAQAPSVDEAIADGETGHDPAAAQAKLETLLADATLTKDDHARVALALSRLVDATDHERAIKLAEDAVAAGSSDAEDRLFTLLSGNPPPNRYARRGPIGEVTPAARAFAKYWPAATPDRQVEIEMDMFGGTDSGGGPRGAFDVSSALREAAVAACGLCDTVKTDIHTHSSRESNWASIPRYESKLDHALVVVYVDADTIPPARYQKWVAAPIADVQAAIGRGEGMFAIKDRTGAPPLVLIAAPRLSQFGTVEAKLAQTSAFPAEPVKVALSAHLEPAEIQDAVRMRFGAYRKCYETLLGSRPGAGGRMELAFTIGNDGKPRDVVVDLSSALKDDTLATCVKTTTEHLRFPAWSADPKATTTVKYPIVVTP